MSYVKDAMNETNNEEPLVTDNSVINDPSYFKLLECGKNSFKQIYAIYERSCMATSRVNEIRISLGMDERAC